MQKLKYPKEKYTEYFYALPSEEILNESESLVTTRKNHTCCDCRKEIPKGDYALYHKGLITGRGWESYYVCTECVEKYIPYNFMGMY